MSRAFRVIAEEHEEHIVVPKEQFGDWETERSVKFESVEIVPQDAKGNYNTHYVGHEHDGGDLGIDWDYDGDTITLIVFRYRDGDTFGHSTGNWKIHKAFPKHKEAKKYVEENDMREIYEKQRGYFESYEYTEVVLLPFANMTK